MQGTTEASAGLPHFAWTASTVRLVDGQRNGESRAPLVSARQAGDRPTVGSNDLPGDVEADAGAARAVISFGAVVLDAEELLEDPLVELDLHTGSRISHLDAHVRFASGAIGLRPDANPAAGRRVLDGVREDVGQHDGEAAPVAGCP